MQPYNKFRYIYPPRAETKINPLNISRYENGKYIAQPKYNGSCSVLFTDGNEAHLYNREAELMTKKAGEIDLKGIHSGCGWMVVCGELMDKAKLDEHGKKMQGFIIWDVLVYEGKYLVGSTLGERLDMLENLFPTQLARVDDSGKLESYRHLSLTSVQGVYRSPVYYGQFEWLYNDLVKTDAYEGLVFKRAEAKLDFGYNPNNNSQWQFKCRKRTKNYSY